MLHRHRHCHRHGRRAAPGALALGLIVAACGTDATGPSEPIDTLPRSLTVSERAVVEGSNRFAWSLLRQVYDAEPSASVFLSPLSASMALGMTALGAEGDTWTQMRDMLGFEGLSHEEVGVAYEGLLEMLLDLDPQVRLDIANSLWHRDAFTLEAPFLDAVRTHFDAHVEGLDFNDPGAAAAMNRWASDATQGKIDEVVQPPIDPLTMLFLMNAVYFKGDWRSGFDPDATQRQPFHRLDGGTTPVRLMELSDTLRYAAGEGWVGVELPYGGGAWVMDVIVPEEGRVGDVVADLPSAVAALHSASRGGEVRVFLPRFRLEWKRVLNDDLAALGMTDAFSPAHADFGRMRADARDLGLYVKQVRQNTFVEVNEEGTEAAAVTVVEVGVVCACGPPTVRADRPFLVVIRERLSGTVLFAGAIVEPPVEG
ncbi:MAG: serpin family protein [Gemmatimonadetes bacterium]|nr:serpin family protein [Gemmatimonadota bacterium]